MFVDLKQNNPGHAKHNHKQHHFNAFRIWEGLVNYIVHLYDFEG